MKSYFLLRFLTITYKRQLYEPVFLNTNKKTGNYVTSCSKECFDFPRVINQLRVAMTRG